MSVGVLTGAQAWGVMEREAWRSDWDRLFAQCPWSTAFQSSEFVLRWFRAHRDAVEPVVVSHEDRGVVDGLLFLARSPSGALSAAGGEMAHDHGWLARPLRGSYVLEAMLRAVHEQLHPERLILERLPHGAPVDWLWRGRSIGRFARSHIEGRHRLCLSANRVKKKLDKRGNASQVPFLRQLGALSLERVKGPELERTFRRFVRWREERRQERGRRAPYLEDPDRVSLLVHQALDDGPLELTVLKVGDTEASLIAAFRGGSTAHLELFAEAPSLEQHAPTMVHLHLLEEHLLPQGVTALDVSHDDEWLHLLAPRDEAQRVELMFQSSQRWLKDLRSAALSASRSLLRRL